MTKAPRQAPSPGERINLQVLDETAVGMRVHTEVQGSLMDNWTVAYNGSEAKKPTADPIGKLCMIRTADGRNLTQRLYAGDGQGWTLLSTAGAVEQNVEIEWAAPIRMIIPR